MGIDDAKGLLLALQIFDDTGQDDVLDDICKIPRDRRDGNSWLCLFHAVSLSARVAMAKRKIAFALRRSCNIPALVNVTYSPSIRSFSESSLKCLVASF